MSPEITRWAVQGKVKHKARAFVESDMEDVSLVYAATEDDEYNGQIADMAAARQIPANAADFKSACRFITPALVDRAPGRKF